jgi:CHAD domain-containing protein
MTATITELENRGGHPPGRPATPARALGREPHESEPQLGPSSPAGQVVVSYLRAQAGRLKSLDPMVRADEPDSVHQMRVATRRLRSTFRSFRGIIPRPASEPLATELKWLGDLLGEARDNEVLAGHLQAHLEQVPVEQLVGPVRARLQRHFAPARAEARAKVLAGLDSGRYLALLGELDRLTANPPLTPQAAMPAEDVLPAMVRRPYRQTARRMRRARRAPVGAARDAAFHQARKSAKRARYAGETVAPALGRKPQRFAKQMKKVQSLLGAHHDAVIARQFERELGMTAHLSGENAFTYGLLHQHETRDSSRLEEQALRAWKRASRRRYRRWLRKP